MITFRDATDAERHGHVRSSWLYSILPRAKHLPPSGVLPAPRRGHRMSLGFARRALVLAVEELLDDERVRVVVAEHERVPGEILGWVAFDHEHVHFVRRPSDYKSKGLGGRLVALAEGREPSYHTPAGDALARAVSCTKGETAA